MEATTHRCLRVASPVRVEEAGVGIGSPGPAQVRETQGGAYQHRDPAGPDGVAQIDLSNGGQLMLNQNHTVHLLQEGKEDNSLWHFFFFNLAFCRVRILTIILNVYKLPLILN